MTAIRPRSVLLVDPLPEQREIYRVLFEHAGLRVIEAADGKTALALARAHLPDVVVLEPRLPDVDGAEVTRALAAGPGTHRIPVIVLTASPVWERAAGIAETLLKPVLPRAALAAVRRHLAPLPSSEPYRAFAFG